MTADKTIFISIACLADIDVVATVKNAFEKAAFPDRVRVGICLQIDLGDIDFQVLAEMTNVRVDLVPFEESLGPIYARYRCEQLIDSEDYYLQIDCHSRFFQNWDEKLISEHSKCKKINPKAVISHYPININRMQDEDALRVIGHVNRFRQIDREGIKSHGGLISIPENPLPSVGISAAMVFMETKTKKEVLFDPNLHFGLHAAEQVLYAVRLWTHGYDIFCPMQHTVATEYEGARDRIPQYIKATCSENRGEWPLRTWSKVKYILGLDQLEDVHPIYREEVGSNEFNFGLGTERSLFEYYQFAKIDEKLIEIFPHSHFHKS